MDTVQGAGARRADTSEVIEGLNDLLQLDHDAIGAYEIAIEKLEDRDHADQIAGFKRDHERHIRDLNQAVAALGGTPVNEPHATGPFKEALQRLGALAGDRGVLIAWRTNELQVRTKYDDYASKANFWPDDVKRLIDENALDEERHYQWVVQALERLGVGGEEGMGGKLVGQVREKAGDAVAAVREKAGDVGETVRDRAAEVASSARAGVASAADSARMGVAGGMESAAQRLDRIAAEQADGHGGARERVGDAAHRVAGGMEGAAGYLRSADAHRVQADIEGQIRDNPLQSLLVLFAAGFVIGRILR